MKVFYTPVINGEYAELAKRRVADIPDAEAYKTVERLTGQTGVDELDSRGWTKIKASAFDANQSGYFTYQQDEL